jgi:hypothetical protein
VQTVQTILYQEVHGDTTYRLLGSPVGNGTVYGVEVETLSRRSHTLETVSAVSTDCQTSMLLLELAIRGEVTLEEVAEYASSSSKLP